MIEKNLDRSFFKNFDFSEKYYYSIKQICKTQLLWSFFEKDGWVLLGSEEDEFFPLWPNFESASLCIPFYSKNTEIRSIPLKRFIEEDLTYFEKKNISVIACHDKYGQGPCVTVKDIKKDLNHELSKEKNYKISLKSSIKSLQEYFEDEFCFINKTSEKNILFFEKESSWKMPSVLKFFYTEVNNGFYGDCVHFYSLYDATQKKTFVDNIQRINDKMKSPWFKGDIELFNDYLIIGRMFGDLFCIKKECYFEDPFVYVCKNPNSKNRIRIEIVPLEFSNFLFDLSQKLIDEDQDYEESYFKTIT